MSFNVKKNKQDYVQHNYHLQAATSNYHPSVLRLQSKDV